MSSEFIRAECIRKATAILTIGQRNRKKPLSIREVIDGAKELEQHITREVEDGNKSSNRQTA